MLESCLLILNPTILSNSMASDILLNFLDLFFPIIKYLLVQEALSEEVIFELKPDFEKNLDVNFWGKCFPGRGNGRLPGLAAEASLDYLKSNNDIQSWCG